jgi:hypothetical protein
MGNKKDYAFKYQKKYRDTPIGRAFYMVTNYNNADSKYERGKGDLTPKWIVENILFQPCAHCGKTGWDIIGCNRLDNSKPHTMDNVEPCCFKCNQDMWGKEVAKKIYQYTLDNELVKVWDSTSECGRSGYNRCSVRDCCKGRLKKHKGYKWSYEPL